MKKGYLKDLGNTLRLILILFGVILFVAVFALIPKIFSSHDMLYQTIAVVLSVVFTAIVTNQLLTGQSSKEEAREKNIKVHDMQVDRLVTTMEMAGASISLMKLDDEIREYYDVPCSSPYFTKK